MVNQRLVGSDVALMVSCINHHMSGFSRSLFMLLSLLLTLDAALPQAMRGTLFKTESPTVPSSVDQ